MEGGRVATPPQRGSRETDDRLAIAARDDHDLKMDCRATAHGALDLSLQLSARETKATVNNMSLCMADPYIGCSP